MGLPIRGIPMIQRMFCSNFDLKELIDIKPGSDSVYIKSVCEPFDQEMEMDWGLGTHKELAKPFWLAR